VRGVLVVGISFLEGGAKAALLSRRERVKKIVCSRYHYERSKRRRFDDLGSSIAFKVCS
jgi:hypothetical protein